MNATDLLVSPMRRSADADVPARPRDVRLWFALALLGLLTAGVYLPVRDHAFVAYDDPLYVSENAHVQAGLTWAGVTWAFTTGHAGNWHPLTWLSHMLDAELFGPGPAGPHVVSAALHVINAFLVFAVLRQMTGAVWRSVVVAGLFALHPLRVESVAWVSERKDVLSALFFLLTLWAYARCSRVAAGVPACLGEGGEIGGQGRLPLRLRWYVGALLLFACGLMSKPMLVTLPFVLLLLDRWPLQRRDSWSQLVVEKIPFFALAAMSCVVTFIVQNKGGAVLALAKFSFAERVANAVVAYARYLGKNVWPVDLAAFYPHPGRWPAETVTLAALLLAVVTAIAIWRLRRGPYLAVGWFWFCGMLVPTIGLVQVGSQSIADRYTYLPAIGLLMALVWGVAALATRWRAPIGVMAAACLVAVATCATLTAAQVSRWRDTETLFRHAIAVTSGNGLAHDKIGFVLMERGDVDEALAHFRTAVELQPGFPELHNNLANAWWKKGHLPEAVASYRRALDIAPDQAVTHENLGVVLLEAGETTEALSCFRRAIELRPELVQSQNNLASLLLEQGRFDEARRHVERALEVAPDYPPARENLGSILLHTGNPGEAVAHFVAVLERRPESVSARMRLGQAYLESGELDAAQAELEKALVLEPEHAQAHYLLGCVALQRGKAGEAAARFERTLALYPESVDAHRELARARVQLGDPKQALTHLRAALRVNPLDAGAAAEIAWLLATSPDDRLRNGAEALMFAQRANQRAGGRDPRILRTLAAAYAETGRFEQAVATAEQALARLEQAPQEDTAVIGARAELEAYRADRPWRSTAVSAETN